MMIILGIHGGLALENEVDPFGHLFHDACATILKDGQIVAAIEEERLSRIKHTNCFPSHAIDFCLRSCSCTLREVDLIAINRSEHISDLIERERFLADPGYDDKPSARMRLGAQFERVFGIDVADKLRFCHHQLAHAWSATALSGFENSLLLSLDGDGDNASGVVMQAQGMHMTKLRELSILQSLGHLYLSLIKVLGYGRFDEYKVMGLAPYGNPSVYGPVLSRCFTLLPKGDYLLQDHHAWFATLADAGLIDCARRRGQPFTQVHKDLAASFQWILESIVLHLLEYFHHSTGMTNLCMVGGVAQNSSLNGKIAYSGLFEKIFVQPASHDAGGALGAALWAHHSACDLPAQSQLPHVYFGTDVGDDLSVKTAIASWTPFITALKVDDVTVKAADLLAKGHVLGWMQGRSEFGPRALGNRSILADPRPATNKDRINRMIKMRESYRPFAPSILEERVGDYYDVPRTMKGFPFMAVVLKANELCAQALGAVTHVDGTARVQTVSQQSNPAFWRLINEFEKRTGIPVLLNTSFNNNAEPIVNSINDAVTCFLTSGMDFLVIGDWLIDRRPEADMTAACRRSYPILAPARRLVCTKHRGSSLDHSPTFQLDSIKSKEFLSSATTISDHMFRILTLADGAHTFEQLLTAAGYVDMALQTALVHELRDLWTARSIILLPECCISTREQSSR